MEEVEFDKYTLTYTYNKNDILKQITKLKQKCDTNSNVDLMDLYNSLIRIRHDIIHYSLLDALGQSWANEQKIGEFLNIEGTDHWLTQTPDILLWLDIENEKKLLVIEVSVSFDIEKSRIHKRDKYNDLLYNLRVRGIQYEFIHINLKTSYSNIDKELMKLRKYIDIDFDIRFVNEALDLLVDTKRWLSRYIDKTYFRDEKIAKYAKEESVMEDIGVSKDIDIDADIFDNFNDKFDTLNDIKDTIEKTDEETLVTFLKDVLNNETCDIYKKYRDGILTEDQFKLASKKINDDNDRRIKQRIKPTIHICIPINEEISKLDYIYADDKLSEQKMIYMFSKYINELNIPTDNKYYTFIKEIMKNVVITLGEDNPNYKINDDLFHKGFYTFGSVNTKELYDNYMAYHEIHSSKDNNKIKLFSKKTCNITELYSKDSMSDEDWKRVTYYIEQFPDELNKLYRRNLSYFDFLKEYCDYDDEYTKNCVFKTKTIFISMTNMSETAQKVWHKTGINYFKYKPDIKKTGVEETISFSEKEAVNDFINILSSKRNKITKEFGKGSTYSNYKFSDYLQEFSKIDSIEACKMKEVSIDESMFFFKKLEDTNCFDILLKSYHIVNQLIHFSTLNLKPKTFSFFNAGIPNAIYIVAGCYNKLFSENGKPFMFVCITKDPNYYNHIFGDLHLIEIDDGLYLVISRWCRLPTSKLTHMKDSFFSVLSSTMNSMMSSKNFLSSELPNKYQEIFSLRALISLSTNQKIAELLVDTRYAYMSSLAIYTNIEKLLYDKFGPPYKCSLEVWIVDRLLTMLPQIHNAVLEGKIKLNVPEYLVGKRNLTSTGGEIEMPSLWLNHIILDINEIIDEIFIYVHTPKDPSNIFHEQVKAMKTIIEFQQEYDELDKKYQRGLLITEKDYYNYLIKDTRVGSSCRTIYDSVIHTQMLDKPNFQKIINDINNETISEIISTKAVISDLNREVISDKKPTKREYDKYLKKAEFYGYKNIIEYEDFKMSYIHSETKHYSSRKMRQKVFETALDYIEDYDDIHRTIDVANHFVKKENGKVIADICIKSQYGSKREFYVINFGAKALARCGELFFRKLSEQTHGEAISIPGDKKLISMQNMLDDILLNIPIGDDYKIMFINGDCTKWSAAETLSSFISMTYAMKDKISDNMFRLLLCLYNSWSDKNIQVPIDIINKVIEPYDDNSIESKNIRYLLSNITSERGTINSTQNFLQGMFNYASSYKAICCLNYTYHIWKKIYGKKEIIMECMAHSDDYVAVVLYRDAKMFEKFRTLQKIMMRLHGYNDSERKTNCQNVFMEFVSLLSFNGVMLYPQIKKSKEINTNLPCTGYKQDISAALSRTAECLRVGCNLSFCYFFEKLHAICVAESYSILPGMYNSYTNSFKIMMERPIELFGLPDMCPLFLLYCRGDGNNYRLFKYGKSIHKKTLYFLYYKAIENKKIENYSSEDKDYAYSLASPVFLYDTKNKSLTNLRKSIKWLPDDSNEFWSNHISYRFLKPRNRPLLISWLKSMFFNRSFTEAYSKSSRTKMTMRLSTFTKNYCIKMAITMESFFRTEEMKKNLYTISSYITEMEKELNEFLLSDKCLIINSKDKIQLLKIITKCDPSITAIYSLLSGFSITQDTSRTDVFYQIGNMSPKRITNLELINNTELLLQMLYNPADALIDNRYPKSTESLEKDLEQIHNKIDETFLKKDAGIMEVLTTYNDISISNDKGVVLMGYDKTSKQLMTQIADIIRYNYLPYRHCNVNISGIIEVIDPFTGETLYIKGSKLSKDLTLQSLESICLLYVYFTRKCNLPLNQFKDILSKLQFKTNTYIDRYLSSYEVLDKLTITYCDSFNISFYHRKIAAYLKSVLVGDNSLMYNILESSYSFTYKYTKRGRQIGREYRGTSEFSFTHFNKHNKVIGFEDYKRLVVIYNNPIKGLFNIHFNIARYVLGWINEQYFHQNAYKREFVPIRLPFDEEKELKKFLKDEKILYAFVYKNGTITKLNVVDITTDIEILPFLVTKKSLYTKTQNKKNIGKTYFDINLKTLSVNVGKQKAFMLPYWRCDIHDNVKITENIILDEEIDITHFFKNNNLKHYIVGNMNKITKLPTKLNYSKIWEDIEETFPKNRIYWFDYEKVLDYDLDSNVFGTFLKKKKKEKGYIPLVDTRLFKINPTKEIDENGIPLKIEKEQVKDINSNLDFNILKDHMDDLLQDVGAFGDDFLVDDLNYDENIDFYMMADDDFDDLPIFENKEKTILESLKFEVNLDSSFLVQPTDINKKKDKSHINFMLNKLYNSLSYYTVAACKEMIDFEVPKFVTIFSFFENYKLIFSKEKILQNLENSGINVDNKRLLLLLLFYKLNCMTYLRQSDDKRFTFTIGLDKEIKFRYIDRVSNTIKMVEKLKKSKNVSIINLNNEPEQKYIDIIININYGKFLERFKKIHSTWVPNLSLLTRKSMESINSIYDNNDIDDLLSF